MTVKDQAILAKQAATLLAIASTGAKNDALAAIAKALDEHRPQILTANAKDIEAAKAAGMEAGLLDRLTLTEDRITSMIQGTREVIALEDPVGEFVSMSTRPNGLVIGKKRTPLGVIAIIYESRPNVTVDAAVLCLKAGNAVVLRGGKEAIHTNTALMSIMRDALVSTEIPADALHLVQDTSRESATALMTLTGLIDVLIPRGGASLIRTVVENTKVPVIETGVGVCHVYVDAAADLQMAAEIIANAKCSRPSVCNAAECLLVHKDIAEVFLPKAKAMLDAYKVELRGDEHTRQILGACVVPAGPDDYDTEFYGYILAVKIVDSLDDALAHIRAHGTGHSECIVTDNYTASQHFLNAVDAAAVYVNASTRFTDGGMFGLGAEIGISTQKMHARGPMGLRELTCTKFVIYGNGQIR
ncbi:MAG: glutamate-5-semialdehyde dehydrogenase [Oscillospiraceae bacterium]|nr:glutamate-5-semialdehyde dehydrogenase [Oscillospiraceae bacterium]